MLSLQCANVGAGSSGIDLLTSRRFSPLVHRIHPRIRNNEHIRSHSRLPAHTLSGLAHIRPHRPHGLQQLPAACRLSSPLSHLAHDMVRRMDECVDQSPTAAQYCHSLIM